MNIKNMLLTAGLAFSVVTTALPVGEQYKDLVYTMHALDQDFSQSEFVKNNIDRIIDLFNIQIRIVEKELASVDGCVTTMFKTMAGVGGASIVAILPSFFKSERQANWFKIAYDYAAKFSLSTGTAIVVYSAIKAYDVCKTRKSLKKIIALDKAIVAKLIELRESMTLQDTIEDTIDEDDQLIEYDRLY